MTLREVLEQLGMTDSRSVFHFRYEGEDESEFSTGHYDAKNNRIVALVYVERCGFTFIPSKLWLGDEVLKAEVWCDRGRFEWTFILKGPKREWFSPEEGGIHYHE